MQWNTCAQSFYFWHILRWLCTMYVLTAIYVCVHCTQHRLSYIFILIGGSDSNKHQKKRRRRKKVEISIVVGSFRSLHITRLMSSFVLDGFLSLSLPLLIYLLWWSLLLLNTLLSVEKCVYIERYSGLFWESHRFSCCCCCCCRSYFTLHIILSTQLRVYRVLHEPVHFQANF